MRARIYCRVSTTEQAEDGYSIAQQRRQCRQFARSQAWEIADEYIDDGFSAKDTDRPALQRMLADLSGGDVVVVWKLDRFTRSVLDLHRLLQVLEERGATFRSVTEPYDTTTAIGRLFVTLVAALAQWERENLGERVREGMTEMVRQGQWHGGPVPFGYRWDADRRCLVPDPVTGPVVTEMFRRYVSGAGTRAIAQWLDGQGIRTVQGSRWHAFTVSYVLRNPVYTGRLAFRKERNQGKRRIRTPELMVLSPPTHEALVDEETWERAQTVMRRRAEGKVKTTGHIYPLTGVLRCGKCGGPMMGKRQKRYGREAGTVRYYYYCYNRLHYKECDMPLMRQADVERAFLDRVTALADADALREAAASAQREVGDVDLAALRAELREVSRRKAKWYDAFEAGAIGVADLRERTQGLAAREAEISRRIAAAEAASAEVDTEGALEALTSLHEAWVEMEPPERKALVHDLFHAVTIHPDYSADVRLALP